MTTSKAAWMACGSLALLLAAQGPTHAQGYTFQSVATLEGIHENDFEPGDINNRGDVVFASDVSEPSGEALFLRRNGTASEILIARTGNAAPGTVTDFGGGEGFGMLSPAGMNNVGDVAFGFLLEPSSLEFGVPGGVFRYTAATKKLSAVIVPGDREGTTTFVGSAFHSDINNAGTIAASTIIETDKGHCTDTMASCFGLGRAVYTVTSQNRIRKVAAPGDLAPGGGTFDDALDSNINDRGDVVFGGHVAGEECVNGTDSSIGCEESLYLYRASTGNIQSIAHSGDPAPGGGKFAVAFMGMPNNSDDIAFIGGPGEAFATDTGVYLWRQKSGLEKVAIPGDPLPGGGFMVRATPSGCCVDINNTGAVAFAAQLDTDVNKDGKKDTGVFVKLGGSMRKVVSSGDVLPGIGTVRHVNWTLAVPLDVPAPSVNLNDRGQVLTQVILNNGENHVIVATPI